MLNLEKKLFKRKILGNLRQLPRSQQLIDFASNDYLGLAKSSKFAASLSHGSTGSRLLTGNSSYAENLEDKIAAFHGYPAGVLFNCGYMANLGLLSSIAGEEDIIFFDSRVHASTRDGIRLSRACAFPFKHNDFSHLEHRLKTCVVKGDRFICIESVYSTDGSIAPLVEICQVAKKYGAHLIVDEAHSVGVFGPNGKGLVAAHNLEDSIFAQVVTFGKALGTHGAIVLGKPNLKQGLINFATPYIYTTALPQSMLAAINCSYDLLPHMVKERKHLQQLMQICQTTSPIHAIPIRGNKQVKQVMQKLNSLGFDVRALLSPTVQKDSEVLRICLHAFNSKQDLKTLLNHLAPYA